MPSLCILHKKTRYNAVRDDSNRGNEITNHIHDQDDENGGCNVYGDDLGIGNVNYYCKDSVSSVKSNSDASDVSNEVSNGCRVSPFWNDSVCTAPLYRGGGDDSDNSNVPNRSRGGGSRSGGHGASGDVDHTGHGSFSLSNVTDCENRVENGNGWCCHGVLIKTLVPFSILIAAIT